MSKEPGSDARRFVEAEHRWLVETAQRTAKRLGLEDHAEDIANEASRKVIEMSDQQWAGKQNKRAYVAKIAIHLASDLCRNEPDFLPLLDDIVPSTPVLTQDDAILIKQLYQRLSRPEQILWELIFLGYSGKEIAVKLNVRPVSVRKRIQRLGTKLAKLSKGQQVFVRPEIIAGSGATESIRCLD